jgi:hypothetical protein
MGPVCFNARVITRIILVPGQICKTASINQDYLVSGHSGKPGKTFGKNRAAVNIPCPNELPRRPD